MNRILRFALFATATFVIAGGFAGCKKSDPGPESRGEQPAVKQEVKQETVTPPKQIPVELVKPETPKVVGPRIVEPTEAEIAEMDSALESSDFQRGFRLKAADEYIDVRIGHLVPCMVDWNNDGKKDMVMGQFSGGAITLFENIGTDVLPVFGEGKPLLAGDKPIKLDAG